jgi:hypothetical protein
MAAFSRTARAMWLLFQVVGNHFENCISRSINEEQRLKLEEHSSTFNI